MNASPARVLGAALATAALAAPTAASAAPNVHVRVEGAKRTLVPDIAVKTNPKRSIGLGASPTCSGGSALGALDAATRGDWGGSYFDGLGYSAETIRGETHSFDSNKEYYAFYVDDKVADMGLCGYTPTRGDHLLLAVAGAKTPEVIELTAPRTARAGKAFTVKVTAVSGAGKATPLKGATVDAGKTSATTNKAGKAKVTRAHAGAITLQADKKGFVRSDTARVRVKRASR